MRVGLPHDKHMMGVVLSALERNHALISACIAGRDPNFLHFFIKKRLHFFNKTICKGKTGVHKHESISCHQAPDKWMKSSS